MAQKLIDALTEVLSNSYILMLKTQNYHWNVKGPGFYHLHQLFGTQYEELFVANDDIAERIRTLGGHAPGSFSVFVKHSKIKEQVTAETNSLKIIKNLIKDQETIVNVLQKALKVAQSVNDEATADVLITRIEVHQKAKWMLESSL